jgi:hypothetical protein
MRPGRTRKVVDPVGYRSGESGHDGISTHSEDSLDSDNLAIVFLDLLVKKPSVGIVELS